MSFCISLCVALLTAGAPGQQARTPTPDAAFFAKQTYPLSKPIPSPEIVIDVTDSPESKAWAEQAKRVAEDWFPTITQILDTTDYKPNKQIKLIFKKDIEPPAYMSDGNITIKASWIAAHPDDLGMVVHELTHVVQSYRNRRGENKPGWLVEGIADYVRWWRYEPESPRTPINVEKASYKDAYRTTAWFLAYLTAKYDRGIVRTLDGALRRGTYSDDLFVKSTGKTVDALWSEFTASLPGMARR